MNFEHPGQLALAPLYVPATRPDRFAKAATSGADMMILDLEDAVPPAGKDAARGAVVDYLSTAPPIPAAVRINPPHSPWYDADIAAISTIARHLTSIRLPKVEGSDDIARVVDATGMTSIDALVENALGVENLFAIASTPHVATVALGEADLRADLRLTGAAGLDWVRDRIVIAARAAGLPAPLMSVWTALREIDGLAASCRDGLARGFLGRSAIHPVQVAVIKEAFHPSSSEIDHARAVLETLAAAEASGKGASLLPNGDMVDDAMRRHAERILATAESCESSHHGAIHDVR
jgi:citrate lyase subunit beta/citryl-CoA lyase